MGHLANGDYYEGEFVKGTLIREGRGMYINFAVPYLYQGYWQNDQ